MKIQCEIASSRLQDSDESGAQKPRGGWEETSSHRFSLVRFLTTRFLFSLVRNDREPGTG